VKKDLEFLTGLGETDISVLLSQYPGEQVKAFAEHIRDAVRAKPHVLVAYAWCFYMAVFSGGRWIRAQLVEAGDEFWTAGKSDADVPLSDRGLSFWNFEGTEDGEDIKAEFRARLAEGEVLFSKEQREDVVQEAKEIFGLCESVVVELDEKLGTDMSAVDSIHRSQKGSAPKRADDTTGAGGKAAETPLMWLRRPEVTGAVVALGCLAYVALAKLDVGLW
jgi:heme oxygenase